MQNAVHFTFMAVVPISAQGVCSPYQVAKYDGRRLQKKLQPGETTRGSTMALLLRPNRLDRKSTDSEKRISQLPKRKNV
jgi:hypothetical protein